MAHDKNGTPLEVGDVVTLKCTITQINPGENFCDLQLKSAETRRPDHIQETLNLNSAVVEKDFELSPKLVVDEAAEAVAEAEE